MNHVWVVSYSAAFEGGHVEAVFTTEEAAALFLYGLDLAERIDMAAIGELDWEPEFIMERWPLDVVPSERPRKRSDA